MTEQAARKPAWDSRYRVENMDDIGVDIQNLFIYRFTSATAESSGYELQQLLSQMFIELVKSGKYPKLRKKAIQGLSKCIENKMRASTVNLLGSVIDDMDVLAKDCEMYLKDPDEFSKKYKVTLSKK